MLAYEALPWAPISASPILYLLANKAIQQPTHMRLPYNYIKRSIMTNMHHLHSDLASNYYIQPFDSSAFYQQPYSIAALDFSHVAMFLRKNEELLQQLNEVKAVCAGLKAELQRQRSLIEQGSKCSPSLSIPQKSKRRGKNFQKDSICPHDFCGKRYSSRIALRAHLRNKHEGIEHSYQEA